MGQEGHSAPGERRTGSFTQNNVTILRILRGRVMGEVVDMGMGLQGGYGLVSALVSVLALGLYAFVQGDKENNDDDDNHGGGLMQPVA